MHCNCLIGSCRLDLLEIIELCLKAHSKKDFERILKKTGELIGYDMMACGAGVRSGFGMMPVSSFNAGFPEEFISKIVDPSGQVISPLFLRWLKEQSPQMLDAKSQSHHKSPDDIAFYQNFSINNVMSHGVLDLGQGYASYFGFANISEGIGDRHIDLMKILVPHLHEVYIKTEKVKKPLLTTTISMPKKNHTVRLSDREIEVLKWMSMGKTYWEIGIALTISDKTVKNHVQNIMKKLEANNRQHAVSKAFRMGIIKIY